MIPERREESRLAQQFPLDIEEDGPQRGVAAIFHQVAGVHDKVGVGVGEDAGNHFTMHVVTGARVAVNHELERHWTSWRGLEGALALVAPHCVVVIRGAGLQPGEGCLFGAQYRRGLLRLSRCGSERHLSGLDQPNYGGRPRPDVHDIRTTGQLLLGAAVCYGQRKSERCKTCSTAHGPHANTPELQFRD